MIDVIIKYKGNEGVPVNAENMFGSRHHCNNICRSAPYVQFDVHFFVPNDQSAKSKSKEK